MWKVPRILRSFCDVLEFRKDYCRSSGRQIPVEYRQRGICQISFFRENLLLYDLCYDDDAPGSRCFSNYLVLTSLKLLIICGIILHGLSTFPVFIM